LTQALRGNLGVLVAVVATLSLANCLHASAQQPANRPAAAAKPRPPAAPPRTIVGIALDTGVVPIDSVELRIVSLRRRTFSDANGLFRFEDVNPGAYEVAARRIGFAPQVRRVRVGRDGGGSATFALVRVAHALPPVVASSPRGGLSGVIGDTGFNVIRSAEVYVIGSGYRTRTDSAGTFFLDVRAGSYMVQVSSPGYARRLLSLTIPQDSGRHVTVWMMPSRRADHRQAEALESLRSRFMTRRATARFYSREDLSRYQMEWLKELVVMAAGIPIDDRCQAVVDGLWRRPIYSLALDDAESVEVYPPGSLPIEGSVVRTRRPRSIDPRGTQPVPSDPTCPAVFVWSRH
jgi:hypothetical protein